MGTEQRPAPQQAGKEIAKKTPAALLSEEIAGRMESFKMVATKHMTAERLVKLAQVAITKNQDLVKCTKLSILDCLMTCSRLGLEPNEPGGVWLVPFKGVCVSVIDYRGAIDVARRSGAVAAVHTDIRWSNDIWEYGVDTTASAMVTLRHRPADGDRGKMIGAYCVVKLSSGECQATYLSEKEINLFRDRSAANRKGFSPWQTDYNAMAMKTAVRRVVNLLPRSPEVRELQTELVAEERLETIDADFYSDPETNSEAIDRMLEEVDDATRAAVLEGFAALDFGPARKVQLLTQFAGAADKLLEYLKAEQESRKAKTLPPAQPVENLAEQVEKARAAAPQQAEPQPERRKPGRPKKAAAVPLVPEPEPEPVATQTNEPATGPAPADLPKRKDLKGASF